MEYGKDEVNEMNNKEVLGHCVETLIGTDEAFLISNNLIICNVSMRLNRNNINTNSVELFTFIIYIATTYIEPK